MRVLIYFILVPNTQPQSQLPPVQQQQQQQHPSLDAEPYSLRQFGINMDQVYTPMQTPAMPQQFQTNMQPQSNIANMMLPTNPADSFLFGLTDLSFSTPYQPIMNYNTLPMNTNYPLQQAPSQVPSQAPSQVPSQVPSQSQLSPQPQSQIPSTSATVPSQQQESMIDSTLFRNRPDNPFWSVPSSIELDDWVAYLLPQQPTSNAQSREWNPSWA